MSRKWLRNIKDGTIYGWDKVLAVNPLCESVTEELAFPEKHIPEAQKGREPILNLSTDELEMKPKKRKTRKK